MPYSVSLYLIGVWTCVGFFTGLGWVTAEILMSRILR